MHEVCKSRDVVRDWSLRQQQQRAIPITNNNAHDSEVNLVLDFTKILHDLNSLPALISNIEVLYLPQYLDNGKRQVLTEISEGRFRVVEDRDDGVLARLFGNGSRKNLKIGLGFRCSRDMNDHAKMNTEFLREFPCKSLGINIGSTVRGKLIDGWLEVRMEHVVSRFQILRLSCSHDWLKFCLSLWLCRFQWLRILQAR